MRQERRDLAPRHLQVPRRHPRCRARSSHTARSLVIGERQPTMVGPGTPIVGPAIAIGRGRSGLSPANGPPFWCGGQGALSARAQCITHLQYPAVSRQPDVDVSNAHFYDYLRKHTRHTQPASWTISTQRRHGCGPHHTCSAYKPDTLDVRCGPCPCADTNWHILLFACVCISATSHTRIRCPWCMPTGCMI